MRETHTSPKKRKPRNADRTAYRFLSKGVATVQDGLGTTWNHPTLHHRYGTLYHIAGGREKTEILKETVKITATFPEGRLFFVLFIGNYLANKTYKCCT